MVHVQSGETIEYRSNANYYQSDWMMVYLFTKMIGYEKQLQTLSSKKHFYLTFSTTHNIQTI